MTILDIPVISHIRRNHGLEHATITLLSGRFPSRPLAGWSFPGGFFLVGEVDTEELRETVLQALSRMNQGERRLAIHPNCGTNYAVSGFVAGILAWLGMAGAKSRREKVDRLPLVITLATLGFIFSQPLGPKVQEHITTSGDPQGLAVADVFPIRLGGLKLHRVVTRG
ncbi:MAG TPA: DUF6391 domain-containing protein [Anaerolineales bacterium]|nr:DUF6391 domain-containing protein [Anaerolineales bacterium]